MFNDADLPELISDVAAKDWLDKQQGTQPEQRVQLTIEDLEEQKRQWEDHCRRMS
jgi:hypothetical protein